MSVQITGTVERRLTERDEHGNERALPTVVVNFGLFPNTYEDRDFVLQPGQRALFNFGEDNKPVLVSVECMPPDPDRARRIAKTETQYAMLEAHKSQQPEHVGYDPGDPDGSRTVTEHFKLDGKGDWVSVEYVPDPIGVTLESGGKAEVVDGEPRYEPEPDSITVQFGRIEPVSPDTPLTVLSRDEIARKLTDSAVKYWFAPSAKVTRESADEAAKHERKRTIERIESLSISSDEAPPALDPGPVFKPVETNPEHTALNYAMQQAEERAITSIASSFGLPKHLLSDAKTRQTCPDCKGSGEYRGLNTVEPCQTCGGQGVV